MSFKQQYPLSERTMEATNIRRRYPDRVPLIAEQNDSTNPQLSRKKFLIPESLTWGQTVYVVKKHCNIDSTKAIMLMVDDILPKSTRLIGDIYTEHKSDCGFLFTTLVAENTFGHK